MSSASIHAPGKVLMLVTNLTFGGAETQVVRLASEFKDRKWEVCVVSMINPEVWVEKLKQRGIGVHSLGMSRGMPDPRAVLRLRRIVKAFSPDVVHCHMFHANILGRIARLFCPMSALICTVHNLRETSEQGGPTAYKELLYRLTDRLASRTTIICRAAFDRYVKVRAVPEARLEMVPNGIDTDQFCPSEARRQAARAALQVGSNFVWLAVGRLVKQKDYPTLLRALAKLSGVNYLVLIAGSGPLEAEVRDECSQLGLDERVRFLGAREDIGDLYNAADGYVMSSEFEGFSMALLEAASMELVTVATDAGGNREIVQHDVSGYIVPPQSPLHLARAMFQVMTALPQERSEMGKAARNYTSQRYRISIVMNHWIDLYSRCLNKPQQATGASLCWPQSE